MKMSESCRIAWEIADAVALIDGIPAAAIMGRSRLGHVVAARHQVFVGLWREGLSTYAIGRTMRMDHTTVRHGLIKVLGTETYEREVAERHPGKPFLRKPGGCSKEKGRVAA